MATTEILFKALGDKTRQRLLRVLIGMELSVSDLVEVLDQPQSTVSRHLKVLRQAGLLLDERLGNTVMYSAPSVVGAAGADGPPESRMNGIARLRDQVLDWVAHEQLDDGMAGRLDRVLRRRREAGSAFFDQIGGRWDQLRIDAFGEVFHFEALTALLPSRWVAADIGTGTGYLLPALAGRFHRVIAVEPAERMLEIARNRAEAELLANVEFRQGALERLPLADGEADLVIASLVVHHVGSPVDAVRELRRCVRSGGRLMLIEQEPYQNEDFQDRMGDPRPGISSEELGAWLRDAGFVSVESAPLRSVHRAARLDGEIPGLYRVVAEAPGGAE